MRKDLRHKEGEPLSDWVDRLAAAFTVSWEVHEAMSEISKLSYIEGKNDATEVWRDEPKMPSTPQSDFSPF